MPGRDKIQAFGFSCWLLKPSFHHWLVTLTTKLIRWWHLQMLSFVTAESCGTFSLFP